MLLTQVASPRYSIQDDRVLFLLFEPCECLRIVVSDVLKSNLSIKEGLPSRSHDKAMAGSMSSTPKLNSKNILRKRNFSLYGDNNYRRCSRDIQMQKNDNVTNKALLIKGDANGFVRPHRDCDCTMVIDSLQLTCQS